MLDDGGHREEPDAAGFPELRRPAHAYHPVGDRPDRLRAAGARLQHEPDQLAAADTPAGGQLRPDAGPAGAPAADQAAELRRRISSRGSARPWCRADPFPAAVAIAP